MIRQHIYTAVMSMLLLPILHSPVSQAEFAWDTVDIHGFLSQGYMHSSENNIFADTLDGTFQFNEFGLNFSNDLSDRLHVGLQFFSRDLGDFGNNDILLDWAYADFRWYDWLGFRAGRIKCASGLHMETIDLDMLRTYIFLPQSVYSDSMRDVFIAVNGFGVYGYVPLGRMGDLTYQLAYGAINLGTDGTMALFMESEASATLIYVDDTPVLRAHIEWMPPIEGFRMTGSVMQTDIHLRYVTNKHTAWALNQGLPIGWEFPHNMDNIVTMTWGLEFAHERMTFQAEYDSMRTDVQDTGEDSELYRSAGYYAGLAYRLTERWEIGTYYAVYYDDLKDRDGKKFEEYTGEPRHYLWQKDWTLATRFDINDHWLMKAEIHLIDGTALLLNQYNPEGPERASSLFALKTTYSF